MIKKTYSKTGRSCKVKFSLSSEIEAESAALLGEFNDWDETAHVMKKTKGSGYSVTVALKPGKSYRFRYLLDGDRWENDWEADGYEPNEFGTEDSVVDV